MAMLAYATCALCFIALCSGAKLQDRFAGGQVSSNVSALKADIDGLEADLARLTSELTKKRAEYYKEGMAQVLYKTGVVQLEQERVSKEKVLAELSRVVQSAMESAWRYGFAENDRERLTEALTRDGAEAARKATKTIEGHMRAFKDSSLRKCLGQWGDIASVLKCPVSGDFLWDPVVDRSGRSFEKSWVAPSSELIPNRPIQKFMAELAKSCPDARSHQVVGAPSATPLPPPAPKDALPEPAPVPVPELQAAHRSSGLAQNLLEQLTCPITLQLPRSPVLTPEGHAYDLPDLKKWMGPHGIDPSSRAKISEGDVVPNRVLSDLLGALSRTKVKVASNGYDAYVELHGRRFELNADLFNFWILDPSTASVAHRWVLGPCKCPNSDELKAGRYVLVAGSPEKCSDLTAGDLLRVGATQLDGKKDGDGPGSYVFVGVVGGPKLGEQRAPVGRENVVEAILPFAVSLPL